MRKALYIIGNGFDLANKLNTSYESFRNYMINNVGMAENLEQSYEFCRKGKMAPNDDQNVFIIVHMIDATIKKRCKKSWSCFEEILGKIRYDYLWKDGGINELNGIIVHAAFTRLPEYFQRWISSIDINQAKKMDISFNQNDLFLSFNYTHTLEDIYKVVPKNICHIHGSCGESDLAYGHIYESSSKKYVKETAAKRQISIVREMTVKDTKGCYFENYSFFKRIDNSVNTIISIGFSYSRVDMFYIEKIIKQISVKSIWYIHLYSFREAITFSLRLRKKGYRGRIKYFTTLSQIKRD